MKNPYQDIKELIDKRKIKKAMRKLQAGLDVAPEDLFFMEHLSICLQKKGRYEESIEICKKGLLIAPFCVPLQQELINSYTYSGQIELAKELLDKLDPEGVPPLWLALARGKYHLQAKNLQEAEAYLDRALREAPENAEAHYAKGILLFQQGEKRKAAQEFLQAYRLKRSGYYFVLLVESYLCLLGTWRAVINVGLMVLSFFTPFPFDYFVLFCLVAGAVWALYTGITLRDRKKVKAVIFLAVLYLPLLYLFQKLAGSLW